MADLQLFLHPLATQGPTGIDDTGQHWLDGERPYEWVEGRAREVQHGARGRLQTQKDDHLGWMDQGGMWMEEEQSGDFLLHPSFAHERGDSPDMFEQPNEHWRNSEFYQSDWGTSLGETSQLQEALKSGLPLTVVEQYDANIFSNQLFPLTGQEIVLEEDRRLIPSALRKLRDTEMWDLTDRTAESEPVGDIRRRWRLARRGANGFQFYLNCMRERRVVCKRFFPGLHNLLWYLGSVKEWLKVGRVWIRGTMGITGLQLMICELWGPGYVLHQRRADSWFNRAVMQGPDRILHLTMKCHHTDSTQPEGAEGSKCFQCSMTSRIFEMGLVSTAYFFRFIEPQYQVDVFENIYPSACSDFHNQICWLMDHLTNCGLHGWQIGINPADLATISIRNQPCFAKYDAIVKASDVRHTARARNHLATHTLYQRELMLTEGLLLDPDFENEPSVDLRGEDGQFRWDINW